MKCVQHIILGCAPKNFIFHFFKLLTFTEYSVITMLLLFTKLTTETETQLAGCLNYKLNST